MKVLWTVHCMYRYSNKHKRFSVRIHTVLSKLMHAMNSPQILSFPRQHLFIYPLNARGTKCLSIFLLLCEYADLNPQEVTKIVLHKVLSINMNLDAACNSFLFAIDNSNIYCIPTHTTHSPHWHL